MISEIKINPDRKEKMLASIEVFRKEIEAGAIKEFILLANKGDQWITSYDFISNFVTRTGAILQLLFHASGISFEKE